MRAEPSVSRRPAAGEIVGTVVVIILAIIFLKLCLWQVHRLHDRRATNAHIAARLAEPPIAGFAGVTDTAGALYRRIQIRGTYDDAHTIILPGRSYNGSPGVHILTPMLLAGGTAVLVNRGWVPSADAATVDLSLVTSTPAPVITGLALSFPGRSASISDKGDSIPAPGEFRRVWYTIDENALRAQFPYPLASFVVQLLPTPGLNGYPKPLPPPPLDEGPHLSYAIQWFSFAVIAIVGWITFLFRRRADRNDDRIVVAPPHPPII